MTTTTNLTGRRILIFIGGYRGLQGPSTLCNVLRERSAEVPTVLTAAAKQFVTPLSVAELR